MNGITSLNAGAYANLPQQDIRLSGDHRPTYTQRRRNQMANGGITSMRDQIKYNVGPGETLVGKPGGLVEPGVKQYGILSKIKDKIVDDLIPNELKENPLFTAALVGGGINQLGLPDFLTESIGMGSNVGQNWIGDLLSAIPGTPTGINTILGDNIPFLPQDMSQKLMDPTMMMSQLGNAEQQAQILAQGGYPNPYLDILRNIDPTGKINQLGNIIRDPKQAAQDAVQNTIRKIVSGDSPDVTPDASGRYPVRWKEPLAIGAGIGAADYLTRSDDKMPPQLSVNIPQSGQEAFDDPNLRFKPKEQYVDTMAMAADGGRIGYDEGAFGSYKDYLEQLPNNDKLLELYAAGDIAAVIKELKRRGYDTDDHYAKGGRIGKYLGGMGLPGIPRMAPDGIEYDMSQHGGFQPLGAQEGKDDVKANLAKNEFVMTADAVRGAGDGDIELGAQKMYDTMKRLENKVA